MNITSKITPVKIRACQSPDDKKSETARLRRRYESKRIQGFKTLFSNIKEFSNQEQKLIKDFVDDGKKRFSDYWNNIGSDELELEQELDDTKNNNKKI